MYGEVRCSVFLMYTFKGLGKFFLPAVLCLHGHILDACKAHCPESNLKSSFLLLCLLNYMVVLDVNVSQTSFATLSAVHFLVFR